MDLAQHLLKQFVVNTNNITTGRLNQALRGDLVDLPRNASRVVMDDHFGGAVEYLRDLVSLLHVVVDLLSRICLAEGAKLVADADAIGQVVMSSSLKR